MKTTLCVLIFFVIALCLSSIFTRDEDGPDISYSDLAALPVALESPIK